MTVSASNQHSQHKELALRIALVSTFLSLIPTIYAAIHSNSIVLTSDLLRCGVEFVAIFLSWIILRRVLSGDKRYYDYGLGKLEQLASIVVASALFISFLVIVFIAINRIYHPVLVENVGFGLILALLSIIGNIWMWTHNRALARKELSPILESQWRLFRAKAAASSVVAVSLLLALAAPSLTWLQYVDPIGSLMLGGFLLYSAVGLFSSSLNDLLDRSVEEALRLVILRILVIHQAEYTGLSSIRSRRAGSKIFIDLALEFPGDFKFADVFKATEKIRHELIAAIPGSEVTITPNLHKS